MDSGKLLPGVEYALGDYRFGMSVDDSHARYKNIVASCRNVRSGENGTKSRMVGKDSVLDSWRVETNQKTADVYANGTFTDAELPTRIEVVTPPTKTLYEDGEAIDFSGMVVKAYCADNSEWGTIPFEELIVPDAENRKAVFAKNGRAVSRYNGNDYVFYYLDEVSVDSSFERYGTSWSTVAEYVSNSKIDLTIDRKVIVLEERVIGETENTGGEYGVWICVPYLLPSPPPASIYNYEPELQYNYEYKVIIDYNDGERREESVTELESRWRNITSDNGRRGDYKFAIYSGAGTPTTYGMAYPSGIGSFKYANANKQLEKNFQINTNVGMDIYRFVVASGSTNYYKEAFKNILNGLWSSEEDVAIGWIRPDGIRLNTYVHVYVDGAEVLNE